jgi:ribosome-associated protein
MSEDKEQPVKSKSQVKRELQALRDLGRELVELPPALLDKLDIPASVRDEILHARTLKREALRRQLQRIGKLLRDADEEAIRSAVARLSQPHRDEVRAFHEIEKWRDQLISGDDEMINQLMQRFAGADRQHIRQLVRNARKESSLDKPPRSARLLFQYLSGLQQVGE